MHNIQAKIMERKGNINHAYKPNFAIGTLSPRHHRCATNKSRPGKCSRSGLGMVKMSAVFYFTSTFVAEPFTVTMYAPGAA